MFIRPLANDDNVDKSREGNEPTGDEFRTAGVYYGTNMDVEVRLETDGKDLIPQYDTQKRMFVIDPKDGKRTYLVWS